MSRKSDKPKPVSVYVRCRPRNATEKAAGSHSVIDCTKKEVTVKHANSTINKKYTFDHVYGTESSQVDVYKGVAQATIEEVLLGYNCTVFAYGQTGTGKTYTMEGERTVGSNVTWDKDPKLGLIPRCMSHMFDRLNSQASDFSVRISMLELYNEELFDLLSPSDSSQKLRLFEDSARKGSVVIQGLEEVQVMSKDEVYSLMERAMQKRRTAETLLNAQSSRSHVVFTVTVHIKSVAQDDIGECEEEVFKMGKFNLVDLAGSENIGRSGAQNARAREAGNINQSLLTLGRVITALVDRTPHVPYRESKLTRLLQDSLGGRTQTSIIATISPAACNLEETLSTLDYANRAKNILNKPEVNQRSSKRALIKEYTAEIERLKRELQLSREKGGVYLDVDKYTEMENRMKSQSQIIKEKEDELSGLVEARDKIDSLFSYSIKQIDGLHNKIDRKEVVENQNKLLITNFIQTTSNQYSMIDKFIGQQKNELVTKQNKISNILGEVQVTQSKSRNETRLCLDQLMESAVNGLDTAIQQRDEQHESWISKYFSSELIPLIQGAMNNVEKASNHSKETTSRISELLEKDQAKFTTSLNEMDEALKYLTNLAETECSKIVGMMSKNRELLETLHRQREELLQQKLKEQQNEIDELTRSSQEILRAQQGFNVGLTKLRMRAREHLGEIQQQSNEAEVQVARSNEDVQKNVTELQMSLKHGPNSISQGHVNVLHEQNSLKRSLIEEIQSQSTITAGMLNESHQQCCELEQQVKRAKVEHADNTQNSSNTSREDHLALLRTEEGMPRAPHLRSLKEKRCQLDSLSSEFCNKIDGMLQELTKETSTCLESSSAACQQSSGLINEAETTLHNLKNHVREDLPTGTTPKRAKLNRLKLQPSADISLNAIASDDENTDPNVNPELDMSF